MRATGGTNRPSEAKDAEYAENDDESAQSTPAVSHEPVTLLVSRRAAVCVECFLQRFGGAPDNGGAVVGGDDRALDQDRMRGEGGEPAVSAGCIAGERCQPGLLGSRLARPGDVPGVEAEPGQHGVELGGGRRVVEIATDCVGNAGFVEGGQRRTALRTCRVDPDLHPLSLPKELPGTVSGRR